MPCHLPCRDGWIVRLSGRMGICSRQAEWAGVIPKSQNRNHYHLRAFATEAVRLCGCGPELHAVVGGWYSGRLRDPTSFQAGRVSQGTDSRARRGLRVLAGAGQIMVSAKAHLCPPRLVHFAWRRMLGHVNRRCLVDGPPSIHGLCPWQRSGHGQFEGSTQ